jgi:hypothetical protein
MAGGHGWGGASQRVFQPPGAGLAPALPLLISGGEFLAHAYDATYKRGNMSAIRKNLLSVLARPRFTMWSSFVSAWNACETFSAIRLSSSLPSRSLSRPASVIFSPYPASAVDQSGVG